MPTWPTLRQPTNPLRRKRGKYNRLWRDYSNPLGIVYRVPWNDGGRAPRAGPRRHLRVPQVTALEPQRHGRIQPQLDHHPAPARPRVDGLAHLVEAVLEAHRVVVGHDALVLHAQDRGQVVARAQGPVGIDRLRRRHREAAVELRDQPALRQGVGLRPRRDVGQPQLLDPAVLGRLEEALHPALGLGAAGQDQLDAQLLQGAAELRQRAGIAAAPVLVLEDAVAVGVQGQRPAVAPQPAAEQVEVGLDRLAFVEPGQHAAGGVVDHVHQYHRLAAALGPVVDRGVHLHQLAEALPARPALAVRVALPVPLPEALGQQPLAQRLRRHGQAALGQLLAGEGGAEVGVIAAVGVEDLLPSGGVDAAVGGPAAQPVDDGLVAFGFEAEAAAADLAGAQPQQARGLHLGQGAGEDLPKDFEDIALVLAHGDPVGGWSVDRHGSSLKGSRRTFLSWEDRTFLFWFDNGFSPGFAVARW